MHHRGTLFAGTLFALDPIFSRKLQGERKPNVTPSSYNRLKTDVSTQLLAAVDNAMHEKDTSNAAVENQSPVDRDRTKPEFFFSTSTTHSMPGRCQDDAGFA